MAWLLDNAEETETLGRIIGGLLSGAGGMPWGKIRAQLTEKRYTPKPISANSAISSL